jgi:hypothetical protein
MGKLSFGKSFNLIKEENRDLPHLLNDATDLSHFNRFALTWFHWGITKVLSLKLQASRNAMYKFVIPFVDQRIKMQDVAKRDFFSKLLEAKDPTTVEGFSLPELLGETVVLIVASVFELLCFIKFWSGARWW